MQPHAWAPAVHPFLTVFTFGPPGARGPHPALKNCPDYTYFPGRLACPAALAPITTTPLPHEIPQPVPGASSSFTRLLASSWLHPTKTNPAVLPCSYSSFSPMADLPPVAIVLAVGGAVAGGPEALRLLLALATSRALVSVVCGPALLDPQPSAERMWERQHHHRRPSTTCTQCWP